jgi:alkanesulfonate monooxygenase SsuD/methylene tetrahydromethanopterin reductase-like flavin-dependent oxidoreductase (luciferase family)
MSDLRFGIVLPIQVQDRDLGELYEELQVTVLAAEEAGFDAVFFPDFHQSRGGALVAPFTLGSGLLAGTSRIRFGSAVLATPLHHPVHLAEQVTMLDWATRGRVILGLGIGHQHPDFRFFGVDRDHRVADTEEAVEILEKCFAGEPFEHAGRRWNLAGQLTPAPYSQPRPPIWMGAHSPDGLDRAARLADRWLCDPQRDIDVVARLADDYRAAADRAGRPARVGLFREAWIGDSRAECERDWGPYAMQVHRLYYNVGVYLPEFEPWVDEVADRADFTFDRLAPGRFLFGSPEDIRAEVTDWCDRTGADYLALRMRHPGGPGHAAMLEAIARFGAEVITPLGATADGTARP